MAAICFLISGASLVYAIMARYFFGYPIAFLTFGAGLGAMMQLGRAPTPLGFLRGLLWPQLLEEETFALPEPLP